VTRPDPESARDDQVWTYRKLRMRTPR
jgi:hypothetical protein